MNRCLPFTIAVVAAASASPALAGEALSGADERQPVNVTEIAMFLVFVAGTLGITWWAARH